MAAKSAAVSGALIRTRRGVGFLVTLLASVAAHADPIVRLLTFQDTPDPVSSTATLQYQFQVSNTSFVSAAAGVTLSVPIPSGASFVSVSDAACAYASPNVECNFGSLPASTDKNVTVTLLVTAPGGNTLSTTATANSSTAGESPSSLSQTTSIIAGANLQLQGSVAPNPVTAGGQLAYALTTTNLGPDASSNLTIVDTLPPNVVYDSFSGSGWTCGAAGSTVTCNRSGALANGASTVLTINATVQSSINGTLTNVSTVSATTPDGVPGNNTATTDVAVSVGADLRITKVASPQPMIAAQPATFTLQPRNAGPDAATTVSVTDTLPAGFTAISASGPGWTCSVNQPSRAVTCTRASLGSGATDNITVAATAPNDSFVPAAGLTTTNTAAIGSATADPDTANNTGSVTFTIQRDGADLSIQKHKSPNPVAQNSPLTSTLRAYNNGPRALTSGETVTITDTLPVGESYSGAASFTDNGWSCAYAAQVFTCERAGPLAVGQYTPMLTLTTMADAAASLTNQGCVALAGTLIDPNGANNCTGATSGSTAARADLTISKSQDLATVTTGDDTLTYTLTIENRGPQDSANVVVRDVIPMPTALMGGTVISAVAGTGSKGSTGSCSLVDATVTCNYSTLLYASGPSANTAESAAITITVQRPMQDGSFTNTASVDSTTIGDPNRANNVASVNTTVEPVADVEVQSKSVTPGTVKAGVDATYVVTIRNRGPSTAQAVTLTDVFTLAGGDAGFELRSLTPSQGSCAYDNVLLKISCNIGALAAGDVETITAVTRPIWMASQPMGRSISNTATVAATTFDSNSANDSKSATLVVDSAQVDLVTNKSDVPSAAGVGADPLGFDATAPLSNVVTYRVTVSNSGPSVATGVSVADVYTPPSGRQVTFLCDSTSQFSCAGTPVCTTPGGASATGPATLAVNCAVGTLEAGANFARYLRYQIGTAPGAAGDSYSNRASATANESDSNTGNDAATEPTAVRAKADLQVSSKTAIVTPAPLQFGQVFQWQIKVLNGGPGNAYDSVLTDTLPAGMRLVTPFSYSVTPGSGTCSNTGTTAFSCNLSTIAPGAGDEQTVTVDVVIPRPPSAPYPSSYTNTAAVTTFSVDTVSANNSNTGSVSLVKSSIAGRVFRDHDNDGVVDSGENGVASVSLALTGTDVFGNSVSRAATTDSSGNYLFDNLEEAGASGYTVTETQPSGYEDGLEVAGTASTGTPPGGTVSATIGTNTITAIHLGKDQNATGYLFGELRITTLGGFVYADVNGNGTKNGTEIGIANVTVTLTGTNARGASINTSATTIASGAYTFASLLPGAYTLTETHPTTYGDGIDSAGNLGGSVAVNDVISGITVTDTNGTGYNFAEASGSVSGRVWRDVNRDQVVDGSEVGVDAVVVTLSGTDANGASFTRPATTTSTGAYTINSVPAGTFTLAETQPAGYGSSTPNTITGIALAAAGTSTGHNFGDTTASLSGKVFFDRDGSGTFNSGDTGIAGVTVTLTGTDARSAAVTRNLTTDSSGNFSFTDLVGPNASGYTVTETQPTAYQNGVVLAGTGAGTATAASNLVSAIPLAVATDAVNYYFAELGTGIGGAVYRDSNRNGARDSGEPGLSGVTITLRDSANTDIATATTGAGGAYTLPPQPAGSYTIVETQPAGYDSGPEASSNSVAITLVTGTAATVNFGESAGSLAGTAFLDSNNNGVKDAGEIGLPGITVTLTGTDANGVAVSASKVTSASGAYLFSDLLSGTYALAESQPGAFADGLDVLGAGNVGGTVGNDVYSAIALLVGAQATGYNFGESGSAITGVVFRDANRDGTEQPGDSPIAGVTITLKDSGGATVTTTATAVDGSYLFAGMPAGTYSVQETQPLGYGSAPTSPDTVSVTMVAGGAAVVRFADTLSTLAGAVFVDLNSNGLRDTGETGIDGVSISLTGTDAAGGSVTRTATTDLTGNFLFIDLLTPNASGYQITQPVQPAAFADGAERAGSAGGVAASEQINSIPLPVNTDATGYTFAELGTTISGMVFKDVNANGVRDAADAGLAGITLTLHDGLGATVATATTNGSGAYAFTGLPSGNYTIAETQPAGYGSSTPNSRSVTVAAGGGTTVEFGETTSSLAGAVWADTNNNGLRDTGEPGLAGVAVSLNGTDVNGATVTRSMVTNMSGDFLFADLLAGTYILTETQPDAYADGIEVVGTAGGVAGENDISGIALPAGTAATGYFFGERGLAIAGTVWLDSNRNGTTDPAETPISNVILTLRDANDVVYAVTTTDANGRYSFINVPAGEYTLFEAQPAGYGSSTADSVAITLVAGGAASVVDFGDTAGSLSGRVYNDTNNNGVRDTGEPPIAGVTLRLQGDDARGNPIDVSVTTDAEGVYRLPDISGGTYTLIENQPADYNDGIETVGSAGGTVVGEQIAGIALPAAFDATDYDFGEQGAAASITGSVWRDTNHDRARQPDEPARSGWIVELYQRESLLQTATTDQNGSYQLTNVAPGGGYEILFRESGSQAVYGQPVTNERGLNSSGNVAGSANPGGADNSKGTLKGLTLQPGATIAEQSLPLDAMGIVYDSVSRQPIAGATISITGPAGFDPTLHLLGGAANTSQVTNADGLYQFRLLAEAPAGEYSLTATPPAGRYTPGRSSLIPACLNSLDADGSSGPVVVQTSNSAPALDVPNQNAAACPGSSALLSSGRETTQYFYSWLHKPESPAMLINNHIAIDPILGGALAVTKTTPMVNVSRGDLVPYTITVTNTLNALLTNIDIRDLLPPGFAYRTGSATINGVTTEPVRTGRQLSWADQSFTANERKTVRLILVVGAGVSESEYVNQAFAINNIVGATISNVATAAVRVVPDPVFDCSDLIGKVFDDRNASGYQDEGEPGIANVRVATLNGVLVTTDADGRFHVACAAIPNEYRGSNFVMKLDERTLPSGYRLTTENPRDVRVTRGKLVKLNFGAAAHRVIRVEASDAAFESRSATLKSEWRERIVMLAQELRDAPSIVRVAYVAAESKDKALGKARGKALIRQIEEEWERLHCCYRLRVEAEAEGRSRD